MLKITINKNTLIFVFLTYRLSLIFDTYATLRRQMSNSNFKTLDQSIASQSLQSPNSSSTSTRQKGTRFSPNSSICAVTYNPIGKNTRTEGTGFLVQNILPSGRTLEIFMTNFHVLPITKIEELFGLLLEFPEISIRNIYITPDLVEDVCSLKT